MSELKGDLVKKQQELKSKQPDLGIGSFITQRDSGQVYTIEDVKKTKYSPSGLAILRGPAGQTITRSLDQLRSVLEEENGAWKK